MQNMRICYVVVFGQGNNKINGTKHNEAHIQMYFVA